jgi:transposase
MAKQNPDDLKRDVLARSATLHLHPELVTDELFGENPFFDPRDVVQVKYEMLRRVRVDGHTVSQAAATSGLSRPTYYQAREAFERGGLAGLLPDKKGPKRSYKLTAEVLAFVDAELAAHPERTPTELAERLAEQLGVTVHPKSIARARARARRKKNRAVPR